MGEDLKMCFRKNKEPIHIYPESILAFGCVLFAVAIAVRWFHGL